MIKDDQVYERSENCLLEEMDSEILLYNPQSNVTLHLNESSALIWKMLDGETSVGNLINTLIEQYPSAKDLIRTDVTTFMEDLVSKSAIAIAVPE